MLDSIGFWRAAIEAERMAPENPDRALALYRELLDRGASPRMKVRCASLLAERNHYGEAMDLLLAATGSLPAATGLHAVLLEYGDAWCYSAQLD